jgi:Amt family ammonium transporter
MNFHDFSGSGCIHYCGGIAATIGAIITGPRYQKQKNRKPLDP